MVELLYNFISDYLIGTSEIANAELMATLLTWFALVLIFGALIKFVIWMFKCVSGLWIWRK